MTLLSGMHPPQHYVGIAECWLYFLGLLFVGGCGHHSACSYISERSGAASALNFDRAMRVVFPLGFAFSFMFVHFIEVDAQDDDLADVFLIAMLIMAPLALIFVWIYSSLQYFTATPVVQGTSAPIDTSTAKEHYPGI